MARITKAKQKILGLNAPSDQMAAFGSCKTGAPVYTTDINALQTAAYEQGWQDATDNDFAPYREEMNGVQYGLSRQIAYLQQEGLGEWIDTVTYYKGSVVKVLTSDSQEWYESVEDENTGNDPTVEGSTHWKKLKFGGSGLEICDIGMALYVDETKGLRRYLNGQIVDINTNTQAFLNRLQEITTLHPSLLCTETEWQSAKTSSAFGQVGKFVFNYSGNEIVSVRIPAIVNIQGLFDLQNLGMTVGAGLPNITGWATGYQNSLLNGGGAITYSNSGNGYNSSWRQSLQSGGGNYCAINFNASKANSTYGNSNTVQPEAIQYPYFIQIATGAETENNIINDIELNNPYSLFDSKYSDHELNNLSWLKSEGQWNAKAVYPTAYDKLLKVYNGTETVEGLSVKLSTETYTDYDFVLNTANETFRLPLLDGSESVPSDKYIDLTLGATGDTYIAPANGLYACDIQAGSTNFQVFIRNNNNGMTINSISPASNGQSAVIMPCKKGDVISVYYGTKNTINIFRFIYYKGNGSLYYYVGETVQNANLIDAGRIGEQLANKVDINSKVIDGQWINSDINIISGATTLASLTVNTYDLSNYLPNDGYEYEVIFCIKGLTGSTSGNVAEIMVWSTSENNYLSVAYSITRSSTTVGWAGTGTVKIGTDRVINVKQNASMSCACNLFRIAGYRRIGTNV